MSRSLYGGALSASFPNRFIDVSDFRHIPDNQEVFSDIESDQSFIIELLSMVDDVPNENCAQFHFGELAKENDAEGNNCCVSTIRTLANEELPNFSNIPDVYKAVVLGAQRVAKFNEQARNEINIFMAIIRIPKITTDILITLNAPSIINPESSSAKNIQPNQIEEPAKVFEEFLRTFQILDWGLFVQ